MIELLTTRHAYIAFVLLVCIGLYMMIASPNIVKKLIGLNLFQTAVFLLFVVAAYVQGASSPVIPAGSPDIYASPLPHVIVLTAIVVGVSLTAVGLALSIRVYSEFGTLRMDVLREIVRKNRRVNDD